MFPSKGTFVTFWGKWCSLPLSIYYIKMKSFNTNKIMTESEVQKEKNKTKSFIWCKWQNSLNIQKNLKSVLSCYIISVTLAIQKVRSHEQFQCDLWSDGEFRDFCGAVGVPDLVGEVHADLGQDMRWNLPEVHFIGFILSKLACRWRGTVQVQVIKTYVTYIQNKTAA